MAQQMKNGSHYDGSTTFTFRDSTRYAVVNLPLQGKHKKPQDTVSRVKRKIHWAFRHSEYFVGVEKT